MNAIFKILAVCFSFIILNAHAIDPLNDNRAAMLNLNIPFGGQNSKESSPKLELYIGNFHSDVQNEYLEPESILRKKPALMELPLRDNGIYELKVGGH